MKKPIITIIRHQRTPINPSLEDGLQTILTRSRTMFRAVGQLRGIVFGVPKTLISLCVACIAGLASVALILGLWEALTNGVVQMILGYPHIVAGCLMVLLGLTPVVAAFRPSEQNTGRIARFLTAAFGLGFTACGVWLLSV